MIIYEEEKDIQDFLIKAAKASTLATPVVNSNKVVANLESDNKYLLQGSAILASTVVNLNDDYFLPEHTFPIYKTAEHTPFNYDHEELDIIGHIYASRILDKSGAEIVDLKEVPDYFDIEVDFVVYKHIHSSVCSEIIGKFKEGKAFVSMECLIDDFDYALISGNEVKIVSRTEETAFLTKHLRCFGGEGVWKEYQVARVLKDITFVGMGSVENPANAGSHLTKLSDLEISKADEKFVESCKSIYIVSRRNIMMFDNLEDAVTKIQELEKLLAEKSEASALAEKDVTIADLISKLEVSEKKVEIAETALDNLRTELKASTDQVSELQKLIDENEKEKAKAEAQAVLDKRVAKLEELGVPCEDSEKENIGKMSDDAFNDLVKFTERAKNISLVKEEKQEEQEAAKTVETDAVTEVVTEASTEEKESVREIAKLLARTVAPKVKTRK